MVSTPNRGYALQNTGDNPGTWGVVLNNQVFSVIDANISARNNLSVAGGSNVTLSTGEAACLYQNYTGLLTGSISVLFPTDEGAFYIVKNGTTGAFSLTVKPDGGTGIVVPQGKTMLIFMNPDTTSAVSMIDYIAALAVGTLTLTSALTVGQGGTGATTLTAHGVLLGEGTSAVAATAAMTDGQVLVGQSGADPLPKTVSGDVTVAASGVVTIANSAVTTAKIADSNVTTAKIADSNITTAKIADNNVTLAKLATQANNTILANVSGNTAVPAADTITQVLDSTVGNTQGSIMYRSGSAWVPLTPGTVKQALLTGGASANPSWGFLALTPGYSNLVVTGTSNTAFTITADALGVTDASTGQSIALTGVSLTCTITTSGANGLDTGSEASSTWYSAWVIYNGSTGTTASLMSISATSPTLPSGYTYKRRVGWVRNDASSNLWRTLQKNQKATIQIGSNPTSLPVVASGSAGSFSTTNPTWATPSVSNVTPSTASVISITVGGNYQALAQSKAMVAPSNSYGGSNNSSGNLPYVTQTLDDNVTYVDLPLFGTTIAWTSTGNGGVIVANGWTDNI